LCGNTHPYQGITLPSKHINARAHDAIKRKYPHLVDIPAHIDNPTTYCMLHRAWPYDSNQRLCVPPEPMQDYYYALFPYAIRHFFHRAFSGDPHQRPTPAEWVSVLDWWLETISNNAE